MMMLVLSWLSLANAAPLSPAASIRSGVCTERAISAFSPEDDAERLALARCQLIAGHASQARGTLGSVQSKHLKPYAGLLRAEALIAERNFSEAADLLGKLNLGGDAAQRAKMLRGRALVEAERFTEARTLLAGMLEGSLGKSGTLGTPGGADPAEVRWWLVEGAVRRGAPEKAVGVLQTIWTRNPTSPQAVKAAVALRNAGHPIPDSSTSEGQKLIRSRIATLEKLYLYGEAWELRQLLPPDGSNAGLRAAAKSLFRARDYTTAVVMYARIPSPTTQDRFDHALAASRTGDYAEAARLYEKLVLASPQHSLADTASYKLGYLAYDEGRLSEAIPLFHQHLERYPSTSHGDEARWFIGWSHFRLGELEQSEAALATLLSKHPRSGLASAARYWQARIHGLQGLEESARSGFEEVLRRWPQSGYAWWSARWLGRSYTARGSVSRPELPSVLESEGYRAGQELARAGLKAWARIELKAYKSKVKGDRVASLYLAEALVEAGDYVGAKALAKKYCPSPTSSTGDSWALQLCWPRPEAAALSSEVREQGLPPHLPYSIMTAESALRPWVTSPAGARGLMQLMPDLAETLHADRFPGAPYDPDQLYRPAYNALLGTTELGKLHARFNGDSRLSGSGGAHGWIPLVIAGYNGGPEAVNRWLNISRVAIEPDIFMENIGYTETRRYVRKVLGYMQTYRYVYGDGE